ncbi:hypothetical protein NL54_16455, partial [Pantoea stewartii]
MTRILDDPVVAGVVLGLKRKNHPARWFFQGSLNRQVYEPSVTGLHGAQRPNLFYQCSRSRLNTSRLSFELLRVFRYQWLLPMAISRVFRDWIQEKSCPEDVVVGLNGEFVHTAQLGA